MRTHLHIIDTKGETFEVLVQHPEVVVGKRSDGSLVAIPNEDLKTMQVVDERVDITDQIEIRWSNDRQDYEVSYQDQPLRDITDRIRMSQKRIYLLPVSDNPELNLSIKEMR